MSAHNFVEIDGRRWLRGAAAQTVRLDAGGACDWTRQQAEAQAMSTSILGRDTAHEVLQAIGALWPEQEQGK